MNVLVYNGPGVSQTSLSFTLSTLRTILLPNYTVQTITAHSLKSDPWSANCALLVLPGGRDIPYLSSLADSNTLIISYVQGGGAFLGICAGAYYACKRVEWEVGTEQEVSGERPLRFFGGVGRGCVYPGFQYESESGARSVTLCGSSVLGGKEEQYSGLYYNGGGEFVDAESSPGAEIIAKYTEGDGIGKAAGVVCQISEGKAVLWAIHPEYPLTLEPALSAMRRTQPDLKNRLEQLEEQRWSLMRESLKILGLQIPMPSDPKVIRLLPQFLTSAPNSITSISRLWQDLVSVLPGPETLTLEDVADTFHFYNSTRLRGVGARRLLAREGDPVDDEGTEVKIVVIYREGLLPPPEFTPAFNISQYYAELAKTSPVDHFSSESSQRIGEILLYGEVVTSTQSMLDKNPKYLSYLPSPLLSLATHQLSGRGRGTNTWLSPPGCLQFSLLLRLSLSTFPASKLVFVQYLFGLAVVETCRSPWVLGNLGERIRLKWPNDIYAILEDNGAMRKVGGILVNTSFTGGRVEIVIGCGLNVLSPSPLTSLCQLIPPGLSGIELTMERTAATIMTTFDEMWTRFSSSRGSFEPFYDLYLRRWLHSDQLVQLTTVSPPAMVRIAGITLDHGLLRTMPEGPSYHRSNRGEEFIDLQPDGNSFDLMAGLIKAKT